MKTEEKKLTPVKAIRAKCLDCSGGSSAEVKMCELKDCPLWRYRTGRNPNRQPREMTDEQREAARERLQRARELKTLLDND